MELVPYEKALKEQWDAVISGSRNGTFLFFRDYMDYHSDRFADASLLFCKGGHKPVAVLPASCDKGSLSVHSHAGLTYGGLVLLPCVSALDVRNALAAAARHYAERGFLNFFYKSVPYIYHGYPSEEDLYWFFRAGGALACRSISSAVSLREPLGLSQLRKRKGAKAKKEGLYVEKAGCESRDWEDFWRILDWVLMEYHHTRPVHTLDEIRLLQGRFPHSIKLFVVKDGMGNVVAGCVVFVTAHVAHVQYIASGKEGRDKGALDLLFPELIGHYRQAGKAYLDFGISTEHGGTVLNEGLLFQKEGFGGRAVCYDTYSLPLTQLMKIEGK